MSKYDTPDNQVSGQMDIESYMEPYDKLIAVHRILARAKKNMSLAEQKTFAYALTELKFTELASSYYVTLNKKYLASIIGMKTDSNHLSVDLYKMLKNIRKHSVVEFDKNDFKELKDNFDIEGEGELISYIERIGDSIRLYMNPPLMRLFTDLKKNPNYITMWSTDIFQIKNKRSLQFYEHLRICTDTRKQVNDILIGVREFKEMFDIPEFGKGSYMRAKGGFNRSEFEHKIIEPLCEDLKNCRMINLVMQPDGKCYEKVKQGNRVKGYRFFWTFTSHPAVASAEEVHEIQERVDKNPVVLKITKDMMNGQKKPKKNNFIPENNGGSEELMKEAIDVTMF